MGAEDIHRRLGGLGDLEYEGGLVGDIPMG